MADFFSKVTEVHYQSTLCDANGNLKYRYYFLSNGYIMDITYAVSVFCNKRMLTHGDIRVDPYNLKDRLQMKFGNHVEMKRIA